ncbi:MAG: hypothetical protein KatS3mg115_1956 [Candidatus Poribacteria bacterium]|nr:MAG: hypothetical protein KatS3mg115_1956 [Candidatus Poribacteria bacterium]
MIALNIGPEQYRPRPPEKKDYAIGIIGCGGIVQGAHLPAYRNFGYRVVAACDLLEENLRRVQERFGVPWVTTSLDEFLDHPEVEIIDLAVHGYQRRPIIEQICQHRPPKLKGILSQKPFAMNWEDAVAMVEACERAGIPLMVNQQARWAPAHRFLKAGDRIRRPGARVRGDPLSPLVSGRARLLVRPTRKLQHRGPRNSLPRPVPLLHRQGAGSGQSDRNDAAGSGRRLADVPHDPLGVRSPRRW